MWDEWRRLTKFLGSARIAFAQALAQPPTLQGNISMDLGDGGKDFETSLADHLKALRDLHMLHSLVLVRSFGLVESHCRLAQHIARSRDWQLLDGTVPSSVIAAAEKEDLAGGVEARGAALPCPLRQANR